MSSRPGYTQIPKKDYAVSSTTSPDDDECLHALSRFVTTLSTALGRGRGWSEEFGSVVVGERRRRGTKDVDLARRWRDDESYHLAARVDGGRSESY
jgi:hypothetical protein